MLFNAAMCSQPALRTQSRVSFLFTIDASVVIRYFWISPMILDYHTAFMSVLWVSLPKCKLHYRYCSRYCMLIMFIRVIHIWANFFAGQATWCRELFVFRSLVNAQVLTEFSAYPCGYHYNICFRLTLFVIKLYFRILNK